MHAFEIVEQKPARQELVETGEIGEQEVFVKVGETLLYRFVEPLRVRVHLGGLGIGMVVDEVQAAQLVRKLFLELTAVVGQDEGDGEREDLDAELEELRCGTRSMGAGAKRKAKSGIDVFKRDDISAHAVAQFFKRV